MIFEKTSPPIVLLTSWGISVNRLSKRSRPHLKERISVAVNAVNVIENKSRGTSMVYSIRLGKCFMVEKGMAFSGGSLDEPYDWVRCGRMTCALALVARTPDSSSGLWDFTH